MAFPETSSTFVWDTDPHDRVTGARPQLWHDHVSRVSTTSIVLKSIKGLTDPKVLRKPFYFQCPPTDTFSRDHTFNFTDYDTVGRGQRSRPAGRQLSRITFTTLFVDFDPRWAVHSDKHMPATKRGPVRHTNELLHILDTGTPFELIVGQHKLWGTTDVHWGPHNNSAATLRQLTVEERGGEPDARYLNVQFTEWRDVELERRGKDGRSTLTAGGGMGGGKRKEHVPPFVMLTREGKIYVDGERVYQVDQPATLAGLSKWAYGTATGWRRIAKASGLNNWQQNRTLVDFLALRGESNYVLTIPVGKHSQVADDLAATKRHGRADDTNF